MRKLPLFFLLMLFAMACANIGSPDGGPYDETPPRVIASTPGNQATNANKQKIATINRVI